MEPSKDNELFRQLVCNWGQVEGQAGPLTFRDYVDALMELQAITTNLERTKAISMGVIRQASQLGKSSGWLLDELKFEAQAERLGDRIEWLRTEVAAQQASDESLDLYNERLKRFTATTS
jgi:hypothetical protein